MFSKKENQYTRHCAKHSRLPKPRARSTLRRTTKIMAENRSKQVHYNCRKCAARLFDREAVLHEGTSGHHEDGVGVSKVKAHWGNQTAPYTHAVGGNCSSVFTAEAPHWASELTDNDGRINCPKCSSRVGSYSWSGAPCSCGRWVTPAFQFQLSRIDPKGIINCDHIVALATGNSLNPGKRTGTNTTSNSVERSGGEQVDTPTPVANGR